MKVSSKAVYACVAILELAARHHEGQPIRIRTIADAHGIDQRFLVQILLQLKSAGLVESVRGAAGGYKLARTPEDITLADVLGVVTDRTLASRSALSEITPTSFSTTLRDVWNELHEEEQKVLGRLTLTELLRRSRRDAGITYQI